MGEQFYRKLKEFRRKYPTPEEQEAALLEMDADEIMELARSCDTVREACRFARFAQLAAEKGTDRQGSAG